MKTIRYIFTSAFALLMVLACVKDEFQEEMSANESLLKVRLSVPEIEVKSSSDSAIYAYIPSEVKEGTLNPISETIVNIGDGTTYYNIPSGTSEVAFTNISGESDEKIDISTDKDGNICYSVDTVATAGSYFFDREVLAGYIDDVVLGTKEAYDVQIKRLSSKLTTNFRVKDTSGTALSLYYIISSVKVEYSGLGDSAALLSDETITISGNKNEQVYLKAYQANSYNQLYYHSSNFLPGNEVPSVTVTITRKSGLTQTYTKSLGKKLEPNRHYTVNLIVTNHNGGVAFEVNEPEVTISTPITPEVTESEFFSVTENPTLSPEAGSEVMIDINPLVPYEWTFELDEDAEKYFTVERIDGQLKAVAKETNDGDFRFGNITLKSATGEYTTTFALRQFSTRKHEIIMTYHHSSNSSRRIYIYGENITVQDPNDVNPRDCGSGGWIEINGMTKDCVIKISADLIKTFIPYGSRADYYFGNIYNEYWGGYYYDISDSYGYDNYSFEFKNCRYLETLFAGARNSEIDMSGMPDLKNVVLGYSLASTIKFAEGQDIVYFKAYRCPNIQTLDLRNISATLSSVTLYDCDALLGANFKNFKNLTAVNVNGCNKMGSIILSGCTSLESFSLNDNSAKLLNVTDCTSLKRLTWSTSLESLIHDGADVIEYVKGGYVTDFNFSGKTSLKQIDGLGASNFDVSNCTNLESMGYIYSVKTLNVSNCPALNLLDIDFVDSSEETYSFDHCPNVETAYFNNMGAPCDFSSLENIKTIHFNGLCSRVIETIDLTANTLLEDVKFYGVSGSDNSIALSEVLLPNSIKQIDISDFYYLRKLDLSNHTNLETIKIEDCLYLYDMDFSGCNALKTLTLYDVNSNTLYWSGTNNIVYGSLNLSGCSSLEYINKYGADRSSYLYYLRDLNVEGCESLNHVNLYGASIQTLDFSDCPKLIYLDVRNNDMTKEAIDAMFASLPDWSVDDGFTTGGYMISGNASGYSGYDEAAANAKNWWSIE